MEVIITHTSTDFDGLASMIAAQKLYPEALMVFTGKLAKNVEEFISLHKNIFNIYRYKNIDKTKIDRIILLDTKNPQRTGSFKSLFSKPEIDVHIFDHHPWAEGDARGSVEVVEMVGSTTTLMLEKLIKKHLKITPLEATVLALGIYSDTGSLLFPNTTPRDIKAAAYLLDRGANLGLVSEFIDRPLTADQDDLLKMLLLSGKVKTIQGLKVLVAWGETQSYVEGLSYLTHAISRIEKTDALFNVVKMEDRVYLVARSSKPQINAADILSSFNGAGHGNAASATVKNGNLEEIISRLVDTIATETKPTLRAADIMSSPVKTISQDVSIYQAHRVLMRYGHSGIPVVEGTDLKGIISQRDIEKALNSSLGHAPVKGFMRQKFLSVEPDAPISVVREIMVSNDIGRVPVLENNKLIGIISRTDILVVLHGDSQRRHSEMYSKDSGVTFKNSISDELQKKLLPTALSVLQRSGQIAKELNYKAYIAGGVVRDLLLGYDNIDVDIAIEGDGIVLASHLAEQLGARLKIHQRFGTAELMFPDGFKVDVATARVEFYEYPAALPLVESATLRQDLYRRDFTINAMAASIDEGSFGEIIDYFGGREDLQQGLVRILYNLSFIEDPTRILRAVRFEQRYRMKIEPQTLKLLNQAVEKKIFDQVSKDRIWDELRNILMEPFADRMLYRLEHLRIWDRIFPGVNFWIIHPIVHNIKKAKNAIYDCGIYGYVDSWMPMIIGILYLSAPETVENICLSYGFSKRQIKKINSCLAGWQAALSILDLTSNAKISQVVETLEDLPIEAYPLIYTLLEDEKSRKRFKKILHAMKHKKPSITGDYFKSLGCEPGPYYRYLLKELRRAKLDGVVKTEEQEKTFIRNHLMNQIGER
ncbi:MAG: CBS domain-containing protein [Peptococcaceae bacterium]|nr:CBS domain-containing protein [Peptococcaceae bacterium]